MRTPFHSRIICGIRENLFRKGCTVIREEVMSGKFVKRKDRRHTIVFRTDSGGTHAVSGRTELQAYLKLPNAYTYAVRKETDNRMEEKQ